MTYTLHTTTLWECGQRRDPQGRPHQEDSLLPPHGQATGRERLFLVCDGMGGHAAGEVASEVVCQTLSQALAPDRLGDDEALRQAILQAHQALTDRALAMGATPTDPRPMGTTLALLALHPKGATVAHIGDSRVYHLRPGSPTRLLWRTEDHSYVQELVRIGAITPEQARTHPRRNLITRCLQPFADPPAQADLHHIGDLRPGDCLLLCTDGLLERLDDAGLCRLFAPGLTAGELMARLREESRDNADNHTAILVRLAAVRGLRPRLRTLLGR